MTRKISSPISFHGKLGKEEIGVKSLSKGEEDDDEEEDEEWEERESRSSKNAPSPLRKHLTHLNESIQFQGCEMMSKS